MSDALSTRLAALPEAQRALFAALAGRAAPAAPAEPGPRDPDQPEVLSFAQRRLWFIDQLQPGSPAYNVPVATRIRGPLDPAALRLAIDDIVVRHQVLRTVYVQGEGGEAVPRVLTDHEFSLSVVELPDESAVRAYYDREAATPFDLAIAPPIRATLCRLAADDHVLIINLHHIVTDGWSMRLLYQELASAYAARTGDPAAALPRLPLQYGDFARWQRDRISGERRAELEAFWRTELADSTVVDLPTDRPRPPVFGHAGGSRYLELPDHLVRRLREFARAEGATLYMTLLAGFAATLRRWTGADDIVVGTSVSGRDHPAFNDLIGFFVNTLPLRVRTGGDPAFTELVRGTRSTTLQAFAHQELPFDLIVNALGQPRDLSRPPLTSVMFLLDETTDGAPVLAGLDTEPIDFTSQATKYDLMVSLHDAGTGVRAMVEYPTDIFDASTVDRLFGQFVTLLQGAMDAPNARLSELPLLTEVERGVMLHDWNATTAEFPRETCLHQLFEKQVDRSPDAAAVVCAGLDGWTISYQETERRANQLAHHLADLGVGPDHTVALCLRRGPDLVVAILAVLKAGGAYVPIDPDYPPLRLNFLLADSAPTVVVSTAALAGPLPVPSGIPTVLVDTDRAEIAGRPSTRPVTAVRASNLAYLIYTSGSTGTPKGIALEHRGVVNNLLDLNHTYGVGPGDSVLTLSSPSFDMSVYEVLGLLAAGGTVIQPDPAAAKDPAHWADLADRYRISVWNSAPALLDLLVDELEHTGGPKLPRLRAAFLGGDWIPVSQPDRIRAFAPNLTFVALGGATEASIHSIEFPVGRVDPAWDRLPYGTPMANQRAYILDENDRPVPIGVPGELHLGGVGLARGYHRRPDLTAAKFVTVALEPGHTERVYRTGDVARFRADGVIELLGRTDFRIKLNGLRIEPGEVEAALRAQPGVRGAVVVARTDTLCGQARLVGYVVAEQSAVEVGKLRAALGQVLPSHCVPTELVVLDRLPLNPNGKVDRTALPAPNECPTAVPRPGPAGDSADLVAEVFAEVLGRQVGPDENFFDAGGDSFAAVRAVRAIADRHQGTDGVRVVELFGNPTARSLAARIDELAARGEQDGRRLLHRLSGRRAGRPALTLVCFPHGGGDAIAYQPLAAALPPEIELVAVSPPGHDPLRPEPMIPVTEFACQAAAEIIKEIDGRYAVYGHCAGVVAALETVRVLEELGSRPAALYLAAAVPEEDPEYSLELERVSTDDDLVAHLSAMDGFDGVLDQRDLTAVLRMVRHDMTQAAKFFARTANGYAPPIDTPLINIIGDADEATEGYQHGHRLWGRYAREVGLELISGGRHYFAKHRPEQLAALLAGIHSGGKS